MKRRSLLTALTFLLVTATAWAQGPNNTGTYYQTANGKTGSALKTAMYGIINGKYKGTKFQQMAYGSGRLNGVWGAFQTTDVLDDGTTIRDRYSNITAYTVGDDQGSSSSTEGKGGYNREHSFPKNWFGGSTSPGPGTDLYHIYPTDVTVNNRRGDLPYGENNGEEWKSAGGYSKVGNCTFSGYSKKCFEPDDEWKGDFARSYFYMVTCYENSQTGWSSDMLSSNAYPCFNTWALNLLLKWARQDPVSDIEIARNEAVCAKQHNRNPFIDYPGLEEYVWGSKKDQAFSYDNYDGTIPDNPDPDNPDPDNPDDPDPTPGTGDFVKVTTGSQVKAGNEYIVVCEDNSVAMGALNKTYMSPIDVSITDNAISPNEQVVVVTLGGSTGAWSLKSSEGYLTSTSAKTMSWVNAEAKVWTISSGDGGYTLSTSAGELQYNSSSPRFTTYTSSQKPAVLYYRTKNNPSTGIESMKSTKMNENAIYNLRGQQMKHESLPKGIYIYNGRKFVVK